ncbi:hypothetical protein EHQ53_16420 [Leptospira langatensis]|uniref:Uncharacterized protein n=1 Tax=Leptospira langatensis TaxID=2484983 RepID=A0A5F1ZQQ8_9LEPT|nr:hypothetical protein [Leptospira langatensis]TGK05226.1 hypothetical protein EHO57_00660 [Leptospira langatensis]TGL38362.1 hypothetical protein EHQ53_16420 [Leptospira langatensis]
MLDRLQRGLLSWFGSMLMFGGVLRIISSFRSDWGFLSQREFYGIIDVCLFFGIIGFYSKVRPRWISLGFLGFSFAVFSTALLVSRLWIRYETDPYFISAGILLIGFILMTGAAWKRKQISKLPFLLFTISLALGIVGSLGFAVPFFYLLSGVSFGLGAFFAGYFSQYHIY